MARLHVPSVAVCVLLSTLLRGQEPHEPVEAIPVAGRDPRHLLIADLDGSGSQDVVVTLGTEGRLFLRWSAARGNVARSETIVVPGAMELTRLAAGFLDQDLLMDLVVLDAGGFLHILHGDPLVGFRLTESLDEVAAPEDVTLWDADGDGQDEIVVIDRKADRCVLFASLAGMGWTEVARKRTDRAPAVWSPGTTMPMARPRSGSRMRTAPWLRSRGRGTASSPGANSACVRPWSMFGSAISIAMGPWTSSSRRPRRIVCAPPSVGIRQRKRSQRCVRSCDRPEPQASSDARAATAWRSACSPRRAAASTSSIPRMARARRRCAPTSISARPCSWRRWCDRVARNSSCCTAAASHASCGGPPVRGFGPVPRRRRHAPSSHQPQEEAQKPLRPHPCQRLPAPSAGRREQSRPRPAPGRPSPTSPSSWDGSTSCIRGAQNRHLSSPTPGHPRPPRIARAR